MPPITIAAPTTINKIIKAGLTKIHRIFNNK